MGKCKVVHIGVFFDGTGNHKEKDKPLGKMSNIAKLSDLYRTGYLDDFSSESCDHYGEMIYKTGVGTAGGMDTATGGGAGSGGAKKINEVIDKLVELLKDEGKYPAVLVENGAGYRERIINVFGFSRGAAMARDFINTFNDRNREFFGLTKIRINFVGLYDTVGSFGVAGNDINYKPKDPTKDSESLFSEHEKDDAFEEYNFHLAMKSADKIIHMIASDEVRKNFPLSSIEGSGHTEWKYGGVHSDIGGGYLPEEIEPHSYRIGKFNSMAKAKEIAQESKQNDPSWNISINTYQEARGGQSTYHVLASKKRPVTNELTHITLHRMHELALNQIVPFDPINTNMPLSMMEYDNHTKIDPSGAMSYPNIQTLREKYFHHSARDQDDFDTHRAADGIGAWVGNVSLYDKEHKVKREVYGNVASKAVLPLQLNESKA